IICTFAGMIFIMMAFSLRHLGSVLVITTNLLIAMAFTGIVFLVKQKRRNNLSKKEYASEEFAKPPNKLKLVSDTIEVE
ncbi:MAG: hypothetical protein ACKO9S_05510, partial [Bacteroidota bacterium]